MEAIVFIILQIFFATHAVLKIGEYLIIIPRGRVGYEVIDSQRGAKRRVGYNHLISNKRTWKNCFIKNHQQILIDFADFAWLEQPEGNLMNARSWVWCNGSYNHQIFSLAHDWSKRVTWANIPHLKVGNIRGYTFSKLHALRKRFER